jgi:hypothetical protein
VVRRPVTMEPNEAVRPKHGLAAALEAARRVAAEQDHKHAAPEADVGMELEQLARKVDDLLKLQTSVLAALQIIDERLTAIEDRLCSKMAVGADS